MSAFAFRVEGSETPCALLRVADDFGLKVLDLARPPTRFWADAATSPQILIPNLDSRRATPEPNPADLLSELQGGDTWLRMTRRSIARLRAWFLMAEDPQHRLDAQPVATLAHQASLVRHVLDEPQLKRVLIADEVGLGKTVEAGLILKHLLGAKPGLRVVYFAPARLVANVRVEFERLGLNFRTWVAGAERDATLDDGRIIASIHRAAHATNLELFKNAPPWDVIVVDECHHLSDWASGGGSPGRKYKLIDALQARLAPSGRLLLLSGTPHQGHGARFENLLAFLRDPNGGMESVRGRVIYRIKDDVRDWNGEPLFPLRQVNPALVLDLGDAHRRWLKGIHDFFAPTQARPGRNADAIQRAAGWRCGQALQWATSSIQAGLGYLVRQGIRAGFGLEARGMRDAVAALRPYRQGRRDEAVEQLYERLVKEVGRQHAYGDLEDVEEGDDVDTTAWRPGQERLSSVLEEGVVLLRDGGDAKWQGIHSKLLSDLGAEKVVLFAQPIETVTALADYLERTCGRRPALIVGKQEEADRKREIDSFWRPDGPQYLVSSRAGGEGLNLQVARRLIHVDVPWNPMEMEQRVGRVHRFKSKRTVLVDTVVVKDSREVDAFRIARDKLYEIASAMVPPERFEGLYARVMALVPPDELQDVLAQRPLGPLTDDERHRIAGLVSKGFDRWRSFHEQYTGQQKRIRELDAGQASWDDLADFAGDEMNAKSAEGFTSLRFHYADGEVMESSSAARVFELDGAYFSCGDYGGMPVSRVDGTHALGLGLNQPKVLAALRAAAFPREPSGAAYVRWPAGRALPSAGMERPFSVLAFARQAIRWGASGQQDAGTSLRVYVVGRESTTEVRGAELGKLIRGLVAATARTDPQTGGSLVQRVKSEEARLYDVLRTRTDSDRSEQLVYAVLSLLAAVVE